ncbi:ankyrin repeat domain-containing protein [Roseibacillus persicicus]|uniref:ankyrin repeat domain-containing protein n=1 Tax=Roseibacillus persicicus TaxID=454148 RepID=UPI00398A9F7D
MKTHLVTAWFAGSSCLFGGTLADFLQAVYHDDEVKVGALLKQDADLLAPNERGVTALGLACQNGNARMVKMLLEQGADAASRSGGEPVLTTAARTGNGDCVRLLLESGAPCDALSRGGQTALMWAASEGHAGVVRLLLEKGADSDITLASGFDALMFAVRAGQREVVAAFLENGADITKAYQPKRGGGANMRSGTSPLMLAIENGHLELALDLVKAGADPDDQRSGFASLHAISWVRKTVRGDGADGIPTPVIDGRLGTLDFVRELVAAGADVNVRVEKGGGGRGRVHRQGMTPFFMAAQSGDLPLAKLLVELGADATLRNVQDTTPFLTAVGLGVLAPGEEQSLEEDALAMAAYLLELGADINHVDKNGETAMHGAAYKSSPAMISFLDENGHDIAIWNQKNKYGWTPLLIAQGFRPGNFRPIQYTEEALEKVMRSHGVEPTPSPPPPGSH